MCVCIYVNRERAEHARIPHVIEKHGREGARLVGFCQHTGREGRRRKALVVLRGVLLEGVTGEGEGRTCDAKSAKEK